MAINPSGAVAAPLTVFGSWVTEVPAESVPENISPDNQEIVYGPGFVGSRGAFETFLASAFPAGGPNGLVPTVMYAKSFSLATGAIKNLYFDSNGILWVEDLTNAPGVYTQLLSSTPGSFCKSITAFNREYIAISDGRNGADIPWQYDGTALYRVTQDGPGACASVTSYALPAVSMVATGNTLTRQNNIVTGVTAAPNNLKVGYQVQISDVPDSNATSVVQSNTSSAQSVNGSYWDLNSGQYRSLFNPGTSPLSAFVANGFGFTIPSGATILGVIVSFAVQSQSTTTGTVAQVALWNGSLEGSAKSPATSITTASTTNSYGSAADLWGASLTPAIVNSPSFGFAISVQADSIRDFLNFPFSMQVYYTLSGTGTVAYVESIVINNETYPGQALVTTTEPHGLAPDEYVSIVGVEPGTVANVAAAQWVTGTTTLTTSQNHNLNPGSVIQIAGVTTSTTGTTFSFDGTYTIQQVPSPNQIVYEQVPITSTDPDVVNATANTGAVTISWPIPTNTPTPTYFQVLSCPSATTFYIQVNYSDATWTTGTVGFIWEGIFYVTAVLNPTTFQYQQYGPNGATTAVGTVTPFGQAAPGLHLMQTLFLTNQGAITAPSPPVTFIANGGQYVQVSNIPIGPSNVIGRILAFTGAQPNVPGELPPFYYIPVPAQLEGQIVSTATQINDNTTTSVLLDFSDNTLFAALGISIPGNNLADQIVLDGALGFAFWGERLHTNGQRNTVNNLLNMHFDGGYLPISPGLPAGWTATGSGGVLSTGRFGFGWTISAGNAILSQGAYEDAYGAPILTGNTQYTIRCWLNGSGMVTFTISSAGTSFSTTASITVAASQGWYEAEFSAKTPLTIPPDMMFSISGAVSGSNSLIIDENSLIYQQTPTETDVSYASYLNNPEGMDGVTGQYGPEDDTSPLMDWFILRDTLYMLTLAPSGRLHETNGGTTEPSGWQVSEVEANCGTLSAFGVTHSEADDRSASGGDDWAAWPNDTGVLIFGGAKPEKISQEIQPNWYDPSDANAAVQINMQAAGTIWGLNDPVQRLLMFGVPIGTATAPNQIYVLNYRNLNSAAAIISSPPFHPSFAGKLIATDNSRKWTHWLRPMNNAARIYRAPSQLSVVYCGGNGQTAGAAAGYGNVYLQNPALYTDADFGQIFPYYTTYFFLDPEKAQALGLKGVRLMLAYLRAYIQGVGNVTATPLCDSLLNPWPIATSRQLTQVYFDREIGGGYAQADRMAIQIASSPVTGETDNAFQMTRCTAWWRDSKMPVRGSAT